MTRENQSFPDQRDVVHLSLVHGVLNGDIELSGDVASVLTERTGIPEAAWRIHRYNFQRDRQGGQS